MRDTKVGGWYRQRTYAHFDYPKTFEQAALLASNSAIVSRHAFLPFIGYTDKKRTFKTDNTDRSIPKRLRPRIRSTKPREIKYASHTDSCIFSYYARELQEKYEAALLRLNLSAYVTGYRAGKGTNIDFAAEAFSEIRIRGTAVAICCDISDFFPSIRHDNLKAQMQAVLECDLLAEDWYAVFRAMTKFAWVEQEVLFKREGIDTKSPPRPLVANINETLKRLRAAKEININLIDSGIPQGSPISAVMANVSMIDFDKAISEWALENSAFYRRYSDDILLIVSPEIEKESLETIYSHSKSPGLDLTVKNEKTEISRFEHSAGAGQSVDRPFTYLGFTFDGKKVELRARTLSRYYRRMTYATRAASRGAKKAGSAPDRAFKRALLSDFTHLGRANFYSYARRVDTTFANGVAKRQLRNHFKILLRKVVSRGR